MASNHSHLCFKERDAMKGTQLTEEPSVGMPVGGVTPFSDTGVRVLAIWTLRDRHWLAFAAITCDEDGDLFRRLWLVSIIQAHTTPINNAPVTTKNIFQGNSKSLSVDMGMIANVALRTVKWDFVTVLSDHHICRFWVGYRVTGWKHN